MSGDARARRQRRPRKEIAKISRVSPHRRAAFAMLIQLCRRVGSDGLQQIPARSHVPVQRDQGLHDEVGDVLHDGREVGDVSAHQRGGRFDGEATDEYGQVP